MHPELQVKLILNIPFSSKLSLRYGNRMLQGSHSSHRLEAKQSIFLF